MKPLVDLRVRSLERLPVHSKLDSTFKRPLVAASFRFDTSKNGDKIAVEGFADAKIPLKKPWRFEATAHWSPACADSLVDFEVSTERDAGTNRIREWRKVENSVVFREFDNTLITREASYGLHEDLMPISSPYLLLAALQGLVTSEEDSFGALLVTGSKFTALRLDPVSADRLVQFRGALLSVRQPLRRNDWLALPWHEARSFDVDWNLEANTLDRIGMDLPVVGAASLKF